MPQNNYIERHIKLHGRRLDHEERERKRFARLPHTVSKQCRAARGIKAKLLNRKRFVEKIEARKKLRLSTVREKKDVAANDEEALPTYLMDRAEVNSSKVLTNMIRQKRKEKAGKWVVPIPKVKALTEAEMFGVVTSGKRQKKSWKRILRKVTFLGDDYTRKVPKLEKYIRPMGLRMKKANVTHPQLKTTFLCDIVSLKKNPQSALYTNLGAITKGTIIEVDISDLGLVTQSGKVLWAKYAQVTNEPDMDGCINAVLLT